MQQTVDAAAVGYIYTDNHLLVANKPAGLASQPDNSGDASLIDIAKEHVRREFAKPGRVYLALLHRLDRPTSGIVVMARTEKAAGRMADLFRRREVAKTYRAVVECHAVPEEEKQTTSFLAPGGNGNMAVVAEGTPKAKRAQLRYRLLKQDVGAGRALLEVEISTGVKHQIRCQLASLGLPVAGDFRYGPFGRPARPSPVAGGRAILLHAAAVAFTHPVRREAVEFVCPVPEYWPVDCRSAGPIVCRGGADGRGN